MAIADKKTIPSYLDQALLHGLDSLALKARYLVTGFLDGLHHNHAVGTDAAFKEYRNYSFGDDPRKIDWRLYARSDHLYIRLQESETTMNAYLLLDTSPSMLYQSEKAPVSKWGFAQTLAAALLMLFQKQRDGRSLGFLGKELDFFIEPTTDGQVTQKMMFALETTLPQGSCDITNGLAQIRPLIKPQSMIFLISDFYCHTDRLEESLAYFASIGCEVIFLHLLDPQELDFDFTDPVFLEDMEDTIAMSVDPAILRSSYLEKINAHLAFINDLAVKVGGSTLVLRTDQSMLKVFSTYLIQRRHLL